MSERKITDLTQAERQSYGIQERRAADETLSATQREHARKEMDRILWRTPMGLVDDRCTMMEAKFEELTQQFNEVREIVAGFHALKGTLEGLAKQLDTQIAEVRGEINDLTELVLKNATDD